VEAPKKPKALALHRKIEIRKGIIHRYFGDYSEFSLIQQSNSERISSGYS
jgi:hypothetical protein